LTHSTFGRAHKTQANSASRLPPRPCLSTMYSSIPTPPPSLHDRAQYFKSPTACSRIILHSQNFPITICASKVPKTMSSSRTATSSQACARQDFPDWTAHPPSAFCLTFPTVSLILHESFYPTSRALAQSLFGTLSSIETFLTAAHLLPSGAFTSSTTRSTRPSSSTLTMHSSSATLKASYSETTTSPLRRI
jgi:hypothetical protein